MTRRDFLAATTLTAAAAIDLRAKGFTESDVDQLLIANPRAALTLQHRLLT